MSRAMTQQKKKKKAEILSDLTLLITSIGFTTAINKQKIDLLEEAIKLKEEIQNDKARSRKVSE